MPVLSCLFFLGATANSGVRAPFAKGDEWVYTRKLRFSNKQEQIDQTQVEEIRFSIEEAREDGFKLQTSTIATSTLLGDIIVPAALGLKPTIREFGLFLNGAYAFSPNFTDPLEDRLTRLLKGLAADPTDQSLNLPNQWQRDYIKSENGVGPGAMALGIGKRRVGEADIMFSYREIDGGFPIRASGTATLAVPIRIAKKIKAELGGVRIPGGDALVDVVVTYELKSSKLKTKI